MNNNNFKNFRSNLALNSINKLLHAANKFSLDSFLDYFKRKTSLFRKL